VAGVLDRPEQRQQHARHRRVAQLLLSRAQPIEQALQRDAFQVFGDDEIRAVVTPAAEGAQDVLVVQPRCQLDLVRHSTLGVFQHTGRERLDEHHVFDAVLARRQAERELGPPVTAQLADHRVAMALQ